MNTQNEDSQPAVETSPVPLRRMNWRRFVILLLSPSVLALLTSLAGSKNFPVLFTMFGSVAVGVVCGIELGVHLAQRSRSVVVGVLLSFLFFAVFLALSFTLCFAGCAIGGFRLVG